MSKADPAGAMMEVEVKLPKPGDRVQFSPIIGGEFEDRVYTVRAIGKLGHGQTVAWLNGKVGCVHLKAIRAVAPTEGGGE